MPEPEIPTPETATPQQQPSSAGTGFIIKESDPFENIKRINEELVKVHEEIHAATASIDLVKTDTKNTQADLSKQESQIKRTQDLTYLGLIVLIVMVATLVIDALKENKTSIIYQVQQPEYENQSRSFRK
jgi:hypothetical protein